MNNITERFSLVNETRTFETILEYLLEDTEFIVATKGPEDQITPRTLCSRREWRTLNNQQRRILRQALRLLAAAGEIPRHLVNAQLLDA